MQGGSGEVVGSRGKVNSFGLNWGMDDDLGVGLFLYKTGVCCSADRPSYVKVGYSRRRVADERSGEGTYLLGDAPK